MSSKYLWKKRVDNSPMTHFMIRFFVQFALSILSVGMVYAQVAQPALAPIDDTAVDDVKWQITEAINQSVTSNAVWAFSLRDQNGSEVISLDSKKLMRMASNSKLYVSAAILDILGPGFQFETVLYGDGELRDSIWVGDMHFAGSGDPSIDGEHYNDNPLFVFDRFVTQLAGAGIREIRGDIYGNESLFDDIRYPRGWEWDDLSYYYAPEISALSFNRNCVDLTVRAQGRPGERPEISWFPFDTDYVNFVNEQYITPANVRFNESYARILGTNTILLRSTLPVGMIETESLSIAEPANFFVHTFAKHLSERGKTWQGEISVDAKSRNWDEYQPLASHISEPLYVLLRRLNAESDNFYTEMLVKALAAYSLDITGTTESGLKLIEEWLVNKGIAEEMINFRDASGMASANLSTPYAITQFLHLMNQHHYSVYYASGFAQPGQAGTLSNRMLQSVFKEKLKAKTGFISGVRTLSGYIETEAGNSYSFSILTNNFTSRVRTVDIVQERILELIYNRL